MKLRKFANRLLAVVGVIAICGVLVFAGAWPQTTQPVTLFAAETEPLRAPTYLTDQFNQSSRVEEGSIFTALGIKAYNQYLMQLAQTQNLNTVVVAVIDSGCDSDHVIFDGRLVSDYALNFYTQYTDSTGTHKPKVTENGVERDVTAADWNIDDHGHGTHVAGIIADGSPSNVKILPLRIFGGTENKMGDGAFDEAIKYLVALKKGERFYYRNKWYNWSQHKLPIVAVNMSLGSEGVPENENDDSLIVSKRASYQPYITRLTDADILPIVAAGNMGDDEIKTQSYYSFPSSCSGALSVAAYDYYKDNAHADFSYFNKCISLAAPGVLIWSACSDNIIADINWATDATLITDSVYNNYRYWYNRKLRLQKDRQGNYYLGSYGTSMATPYVTLCYALLMSDSSRTTGDNAQDAQALNLVGWNAEVDGAFPYYYLNPQHKALLLAAAAYHDYGNAGNDIYYGYGGVYVGCFNFKPTAEVNEEDILPDKKKEEVLTPDNSYLPDNQNEPEVDWATVVGILAAVGGGIIIINWIRGFSRGRQHGK